MEKTTIYLPDDLKAAVKHVALQHGVSEAEVIRESIGAGVSGVNPRPRGWPLLCLGADRSAC